MAAVRWRRNVPAEPASRRRSFDVICALTDLRHRAPYHLWRQKQQQHDPSPCIAEDEPPWSRQRLCLPGCAAMWIIPLTVVLRVKRTRTGWDVEIRVELMT